MVAYNNKQYYIDIVEAKPASAVSIIETDCEVDFAPPLDYKEPEKPQRPIVPASKAPAEGLYFLLSKNHIMNVILFSPYC
jgi:ubiquitin fusion degradation protein 1